MDGNSKVTSGPQMMMSSLLQLAKIQLQKLLHVFIPNKDTLKTFDGLTNRQKKACEVLILDT